MPPWGGANSTNAQQPVPAQRFITLACSTSTYLSGLFGHLLPLFTRDTGIGVQLVVFGGGQALDAARRGDVDVVIVRNREAEDRFVAEGFADPPGRRPVMFHDLVIVGPRRDPAGVRGLRDVAEALRRIAATGAPFLSRSDSSGSHAAEMRLWREAGISPMPPWYRELGQGMAPTLRLAAAQDAYTLADRGTWLAFRNLPVFSARGSLGVLVEGDQRLFNQYGVMVVSPLRHPHIKVEDAQRFATWLVSPAGQNAIASYRVSGEQLFFTNATFPAG